MLLLGIDLEATGLGIWRDRIVQIAVTGEREGKQVFTFCEYVKPNRNMHPEAIKVTGITDARVANCSTLNSVLPRLFRQIKAIPRETENEPTVLIAYNGIAFDFAMLCAEMIRNKLSMLSWSASGITHLVDPLIWAREHLDRTCLFRNKRGRTIFKLGSVHLGVLKCKIENAHDAMADTTAMMDLCRHEKFAAMNCVSSSDYCIPMDKFLEKFDVSLVNHRAMVALRKKNRKKPSGRENDILLLQNKNKNKKRKFPDLNKDEEENQNAAKVAKKQARTIK